MDAPFLPSLWFPTGPFTDLSTYCCVAQMRASAIKVREALGSHLPGIADKEIEESLWYYYFDVDKSITWLRSVYSSQSV